MRTLVLLAWFVPRARPGFAEDMESHHASGYNFTLRSSITSSTRHPLFCDTSFPALHLPWIGLELELLQVGLQSVRFKHIAQWIKDWGIVGPGVSHISLLLLGVG